MMRFKHIPYEQEKTGIRLQDLKNIDYINEMYEYLKNIEKINDGLEICMEYAKTLINKTAGQVLTSTQQTIFDDNVAGLKSLLEDSKKLMIAAEKTCETLIAKNTYVALNSDQWLMLSIPWFSQNKYNKDDLEKQLPKMVEKVQEDRKRNEERSREKVGRDLN
jgi:hypothetical protein